MYIANNRGPSMLPCGTPDTTGRKLEFLPSMVTHQIYSRTFHLWNVCNAAEPLTKYILNHFSSDYKSRLLRLNLCTYTN